MTSAASAIHSAAIQNRPPPAHPSAAQTASAGTSRSAVLLMGARLWSSGVPGTSRNAASAISSTTRPLARAVPPAVTGAAVLGGVTFDVWNERQIACALDRRRELSLVAGTGTAQATRQDLAVVGDEAA